MAGKSLDLKPMEADEKQALQMITAAALAAMRAQAMPPARRQPRRERPERTDRRWHQCCVSVCESAGPVWRDAGRAAGSSAEANRHEAHKKVAATRCTILWARATPS